MIDATKYNQLRARLDLCETIPSEKNVFQTVPLFEEVAGQMDEEIGRLQTELANLRNDRRSLTDRYLKVKQKAGGPK